MPRQAWADDVRARALEAYVERGPSEASRETGVPKMTIASWARRANVQTVAGTQSDSLRRATEMARLTREQRVVRLAGRLLEYAEQKTEAAMQTDQARDSASWMSAVATAVEKSNLLSGAATSRVETVEQPQRDTLGRLLELRQAS